MKDFNNNVYNNDNDDMRIIADLNLFVRTIPHPHTHTFLLQYNKKYTPGIPKCTWVGRIKYVYLYFNNILNFLNLTQLHLAR